MQRSAFAPLFFAPLVVAAQCLEVAGRSVELSQEEFGGASMQWHAEIENICDAAFDAVLTIAFRDAGGDTLYSVKDRATLGVRGRERVENQTFLPSDAAGKVHHITVELDERERPF